MSDRNLKLYLHTAANTIVPCFQALFAKGYAVTHYLLDLGEEDKRPTWAAEKDGRLFTAEGTEQLLGLVAMWEVRGDNWQLEDGEYERYEELLNKASTEPTRPKW